MSSIHPSYFSQIPWNSAHLDTGPAGQPCVTFDVKTITQQGNPLSIPVRMYYPNSTPLRNYSIVQVEGKPIPLKDSDIQALAVFYLMCQKKQMDAGSTVDAYTLQQLFRKENWQEACVFYRAHDESSFYIEKKEGGWDVTPCKIYKEKTGEIRYIVGDIEIRCLTNIHNFKSLQKELDIEKATPKFNEATHFTPMKRVLENKRCILLKIYHAGCFGNRCIEATPIRTPGICYADNVFLHNCDHIIIKSQEEFLSLFRQSAQQLLELHEQGICFTDIRANNLCKMLNGSFRLTNLQSTIQTTEIKCFVNDWLMLGCTLGAILEASAFWKSSVAQCVKDFGDQVYNSGNRADWLFDLPSSITQADQLSERSQNLSRCFACMLNRTSNQEEIIKQLIETLR